MTPVRPMGVMADMSIGRSMIELEVNDEGSDDWGFSSASRGGGP